MSADVKVAPTIKQRVEHMLKQLPDNCTLEDIYYHLDVLERLQARIDRANSPDAVFLSQEEFDQRMAKWLKK